MCHHCSLELRRGKVGAAKKDCGNRGMQQHLERQHKEVMASVAEARAKNNAEALGKSYDSRDESVCGVCPYFNLNNNLKRQGGDSHQIYVADFFFKNNLLS